ncbi:PepSY-associated TM helix domain-containing protein [Arachidicoccus sp.]|uniref:PepSY-associated TM helix domain-containing protein n=1 Tax=Arachidicoccus sp. TaxID=1872624 RepID=UPI003D1E425E
MPINKKSKVNRVITWLHLWLGLVSGIIVFIVSITGCLFSFQKEITEMTHKKELFVTPPTKDAEFLPLSVLKEKAQTALGSKEPVTYITTYARPDRSWEFMAYKEDDTHAITFAQSVKYYESVFVNPYTGSIIGRIDYMHNFFVIVKYIHWSLLLSTPIGQPIVGWSTLIFVIMLITGIIMWWPKKWDKKHKGRSFKIRWKAKWKRVNYDLHNVLGFYTFIIALILGLTGMVFAFKWFQATVYVAGSLSTKTPTIQNFQSDTTASYTNDPLSTALLEAKNTYPNAKRYFVSMPYSNKAAINVIAYEHKEVYYDANTLYFDQYTGKKLGVDTYQKKNNGEKLILMNYDIHVGAIGGLIGKIIAFLVSLVCASLPITGFLIWLKRKKKKAKKTSSRKTIDDSLRVPQ